jgi:predicted nicotinamide N-methyase
MASFNPMAEALKRLRLESKQLKNSNSSITKSKTTTMLEKKSPSEPKGPIYIERIFQVSLKENLNVQLRIMQNPSGIQYGHGATVWDSAILLSNYLSKHEGRELMEPEINVLSLGCGCGLSGLVASIFGCNVTLTDLSNVLPLTKLNIDKNKDALRVAIAFSKEKHDDVVLAKPVVCGAIDWRTTEDDFIGRKFDTIIAADLMYDPKLAIPLAATVARFATPTTTILIAHEHRKDSVDVKFINAFRDHNLIFEEVERKGRWAEDLSLYKLVVGVPSETNKSSLSDMLDHKLK